MMWLVLALLACKTPEGGECRESDACAGELYCDGPDEPQACGVPAQIECDPAVGCEGDEMCHTIYDSCAPDGYGSVCDIGCPLTPCGPDFACSQGTCVAEPCDAGFLCPEPLICDVSVASARGEGPLWRHGCIDVSCSEDEECAEGQFCVNGTCQTGPGTCRVDEPVP